MPGTRQGLPIPMPWLLSLITMPSASALRIQHQSRSFWTFFFLLCPRRKHSVTHTLSPAPVSIPATEISLQTFFTCAQIVDILERTFQFEFFSCLTSSWAEWLHVCALFITARQLLERSQARQCTRDNNLGCLLVTVCSAHIPSLTPHHNPMP